MRDLVCVGKEVALDESLVKNDNVFTLMCVKTRAGNEPTFCELCYDLLFLIAILIMSDDIGFVP